jgi:catechol 2,3-dioxygenase-like lactoylglutathione lyase family enzyme
MRTFRDAKVMAKALRAEILERQQVELSHSACLEIVARQFGLDNWNILAAKIEESRKSRIIPLSEREGPEFPQRATTTTIPVLRIFSEARAKEFYLEFLGFSLDFGGPVDGESGPYYGQVIRAHTTLQLAEMPYDPGHGATVDIWLDGLDELHRELMQRYGEMGTRVFGPAVWVPQIEDVSWGARVMIIGDPFGNHLRFSEPHGDPDARAGLPRWA